MKDVLMWAWVGMEAVNLMQRAQNAVNFPVHSPSRGFSQLSRGGAV